MGDDKFPGAVILIRVSIGRTGDTLGLDAGINGLGKLCVLDDADRFAWEIVHPLALSGRLYSAINHAKDNPIIGNFNALLQIEARIEAMVQAFNDITVAVAIFIAASLVLMPLVRSVRKTG